MGDMADWFVQQALDRGEWIGRSKGGQRDAFGPPVTCKHCGATGLYWQKVHNRGTEYTLASRETLAVHDCPKFKPTAEGFDDEPVL